MTKIKQTFQNRTDRALFLNLELSTSRFRLNPGEELVLFYDPSHSVHNDDNAALRVELISGPDGCELQIWTSEHEMFKP
ncbi:hypothetical protein, partial [Escherichia coli]|uniref:hypothetical protein n=1 Tax=Escherichia coli TaxID=562 RepID=UPI003CF2189F